MTKMPDKIYADVPHEVKQLITICDQTGCWNWVGVIEKKGYGRIKKTYAHRYVWELIKNKIPTGLVIDHLCRNKRCVNPNHLEPVTQKINNHRGIGITSLNAKKTHCSKGHSLTDENVKITIRSDGIRRKCKVCDREQKRLKRDQLRPNRIKRPSRMINYEQ